MKQSLPALTPDLAAFEAFQRTFQCLLKTIRVNEEGIRSNQDAECLHDFRVAIRRTRALLILSKGVLAKRSIRDFRNSWKMVAQTTNRKRDYDVFMENLQAYREQISLKCKKIETSLQKRTDAEFRRILSLLDSKIYPMTLEKWEHFLGLMEPGSDFLGEKASKSIVEIAESAIVNAWDKVEATGKGLNMYSPEEEFHRLRIRCKVYRYALEAFRSLYSNESIDPKIKSLKRIQDQLGQFNDWATQLIILDDFLQESANPDQKKRRQSSCISQLRTLLKDNISQMKSAFPKRFRVFHGNQVSNPLIPTAI